MDGSAGVGDVEGIHECGRTARERVHACAAALDHRLVHERRFPGAPRLSGKAAMCVGEWPHNAAMQKFCIDAQQATP
jgi:hypothetical protein